MQLPVEMNTVSQILEKLRIRKWDSEFRCYPEGFSINQSKYYQPQDLKIIKTYRFEGMSDPADMSIIYVMEANDGLIGYSLDSYGVYSDHDGECDYDNFIRQVEIADHEQQLLFEL
jgi:hypothetical protein